MKQRINFKTIYLIATITVGLLGLAIGSTYAIFTTSAEINNPISLSTTLTRMMTFLMLLILLLNHMTLLPRL